MTKRIVVTISLAIFALAVPSVASARNVIVEPPTPTNKVIVYVHGAGGKASDILAGSSEPVHIPGFALAASDAWGPQTWGNEKSVRAYEHLIRQLRRRGLTRVFLLGGSMGGLATMQLIGRVEPEAVVLVAPVCDLSHLHPALSPVIDMAWHGKRPRHLSPVQAHPEKGLRVNIWASPEDTWVPSRWNADVCARELRKRGAVVRQFQGEGDHANLGNYASFREILGFFAEVAREKR